MTRIRQCEHQISERAVLTTERVSVFVEDMCDGWEVCEVQVLRLGYNDKTCGDVSVVRQTSLKLIDFEFLIDKVYVLLTRNEPKGANRHRANCLVPVSKI